MTAVLTGLQELTSRIKLHNSMFNADYGFCYSVNRSFTVCHPLTLLGLRALFNDAVALHHCLKKVCVCVTAHQHHTEFHCVSSFKAQHEQLRRLGADVEDECAVPELSRWWYELHEWKCQEALLDLCVKWLGAWIPRRLIDITVTVAEAD